MVNRTGLEKKRDGLIQVVLEFPWRVRKVGVLARNRSEHLSNTSVQRYR
jgi:hypothetical protein